MTSGIAALCITLQHTATLCNTPQHIVWDHRRQPQRRAESLYYAIHCNILRHTATYCNTLKHTATHCNTLQHAVWDYWRQQQRRAASLHYAIHCNILRHTATHCNILHCNTLQHTATYCNTLQHTATHCNMQSKIIGDSSKDERNRCTMQYTATY